MRIVWFTLLLSLSSGPLLAEESQQSPEAAIPTAETDFVQNINQFDKATIVAQFGEPASKQDYHRPGTDELMASVLQYHYINTDLDGSYYQLPDHRAGFRRRQHGHGGVHEPRWPWWCS